MKQAHPFYRRLQQDRGLCELFRDALISALEEEENNLHTLAQEALFNSTQVPYALCQYGKVDVYKSFLNTVDVLLKSK